MDKGRRTLRKGKFTGLRGIESSHFGFWPVKTPPVTRGPDFGDEGS